MNREQELAIAPDCRLPAADCRSTLNDALASAASYALAEKSEATRRAYRADISDFVAWCKSVGAAMMPAASGTVAAYLASLADRGLSVSTIQRRAAAIAYAHRLAGLASPAAGEDVKAVLSGIRRSLGVKPKGKAPATAAIVRRMFRKIVVGDSSNRSRQLAAKRDKALILLGFAAALRRSELVDLKVNSLERTAEGAILHIGRSKTDQEGRGAAIAVPNGPKLRVIEALDDWLASAGIVEGPLFRAIGKGGAVSVEALTDRSVALIIKRAAARAGLDPIAFSGHSLRAGFVTSALESGADLLKIMDVTRHREVRTLKAYDRRAQAFKQHAGKGFL